MTTYPSFFEAIDDLKRDATISANCIETCAIDQQSPITNNVRLFKEYTTVATIDASWFGLYEHTIITEPFVIELAGSDVIVVDPILDTVYVSQQLFDQAIDHPVDNVTIYQYNDDPANRLNLDQTSDDSTIELTVDNPSIKPIDDRFGIVQFSNHDDQTYSAYYRYTMIPYSVFEKIELPYYVFAIVNRQPLIGRDPLDNIELFDTEEQSEQSKYTSWQYRKDQIAASHLEPIVLRAIKVGDQYHLRLFGQNANNYLDWLYVSTVKPEMVPVCIVANGVSIGTELFEHKPIELQQLNQLTSPDILFE